MSKWMRFSHNDAIKIGVLDGDTIQVYAGDMFEGPTPTDEQLSLDGVRVMTPCQPGKMIAIWNNSGALAEKLNLTKPENPLFLIKAPNTFIAHGEPIEKPAAYDGRVVYEAELGIVIGKKCKGASEAEARDAIFGYTCLNDVTAMALIEEDPSFQQWVRAKGFDTFCPFGPVIETDVNPADLTVKGVLNGRERQNYPVSDMFFLPDVLVSRISAEMTLMPGDVIACGTGLGVLPMKPGSTFEVTIDGIGTLANPYE